MFGVAELPLYNQDLDGEKVHPVAEADGIIVASPEYNHTYSAVAKNFIDWASRPLMQGAILGKRSMVISATPGTGAGKHCLPELAKLLTMLGGTVVAQVGVAQVHEKFASGADVVTDDALASELRAGLAAFQ